MISSAAARIPPVAPLSHSRFRPGGHDVGAEDETEAPHPRSGKQRDLGELVGARDVVDLVRVVGTAGRDDAVRPRRLGRLGPDLGLRVGHR